MDWDFIIKGSLGLLSVISLFLAGYKYKSYRVTKKELADSLKQRRKLAEWGTRLQQREQDHAKDIAEISEKPSTPSDVERVLSRPVRTPKD